MKLSIYGFFLLTLVSTVASADVGLDQRRYAAWDVAPYNNYVRILNEKSFGTGQFISAAHILTTKNVAGCCGVSGREQCFVSTSDGNDYQAKVVQAGGGLSKCDNTQDPAKNWVVLKILDNNVIKTRINEKKFGFKSGAITKSNLWRGGFGALKVLTNTDIQNIKKAYAEWLKLVYPRNIWERDKVAKQGANFELHDYDIYKNKDHFATFLKKFKELTGKDFIKDYMNDHKNLKVIENCSFNTRFSDGEYAHNCAVWTGDGGSAILNNKNEIVGLTTYGTNIIGGSGYANSAIPTKGVFSNIQNLLRMPVIAERRPGENNDTIYISADGYVIMKQGGTVAWRNNNPGNITNDNLEIGRSGPKMNSGKAKFAVFASEQDGEMALFKLLRGPNYRDRSIESTMNRYAPKEDNNDPVSYANTIVGAIKKVLPTDKNGKPVGKETLLRNLTDDQIKKMMNAIKQKEGWKEGNKVDCVQYPQSCK